MTSAPPAPAETDPTGPRRPAAVAETPAVVMREVGKSFGDHTVIESLNLAVPAGRITGLIGPSGCGKTTTIRLLLGVLAPTAGTIDVLGADPARFTSRHRERIGYTPQKFFLYPTLTVQENARFVAGLFGLGWRHRRRRVREVLQFLELWPARNRLARDISGGMQRRLELGCALLHEPELLVIDEPTAGLDPVLRAKVWEHLRVLCDQGATVLVTTQYIDEAVYCDTVAILDRGRIVAEGSPEQLRRRAVGGEVLRVEAHGVTRDALRALWALPAVQALEQENATTLRLTVDDAAAATPSVTGALAGNGVAVQTVRPSVPTFDEVFMKIVGRS